jgi:membrane associated rhomboid family serine protease
MFPIGLNTKLKDKQWVTIALILVSSFVFLFIQNSTQLNAEMKEVHKDNMETKIVSKLYLEYCLRRVVDRKHCVFSKPFFHLKRKKRILDKRAEGDFSEVLVDMGSDYHGTKHYLEFYKSLMDKSQKIKNLPSYPEFLKERNEHLAKAHRIHQKYNVLSIGNSSFFISILATLSSVSLFQLLWNTFAFILFGRYVEKRLGRILYAACFFLIPYLVLNYYKNSLPSDSIQYIIGSTTGISAIIGFFYSFFFHYQLKVKIWRFRYFDHTQVSVRYIVPIIYLLQEGGLHYMSPISIPHRAHFFAVLIGMGIAQILKMKDNMPKGFLFHSELKEWDWLKTKREEDTNLFLNGACHLLNNNPLNITIRESVFKTLKDKVEQGDDIKFYIHYLDGILPFYLAQNKNLMKRPEKVLQILALLPNEISYTKYLVDVKKRNVFKLIKSARKLNFDLQVIKLIQVFFEKYPEVKELRAVEDILKEVIGKNIEGEDCRELIYKTAHSSTSIRLRDICIPYIDK